MLEGPLAWLDLAEEMLIDALGTHGVGAKTRAGYGLFREDAERREQEERERLEQEEAEKQAQAEADKRRREEEERQRQEGLSEGCRRIEDLQCAVERYRTEGDLQGIRKEVVTAANRLTKPKDDDLFEWTDDDEREAAAKALEECYNEIGWYDPGKKPKKRREGQENRRRADIERISPSR